MSANDTLAEITTAIRASIAGTPALPHRARLEEITVALTAAWERHDGAAIVQLGADQRDLLMNDVGTLVSLSTELLRALGSLTGQRPEKLLEAIVEAL